MILFLNIKNHSSTLSWKGHLAMSRSDYVILVSVLVITVSDWAISLLPDLTDMTSHGDTPTWPNMSKLNF